MDIAREDQLCQISNGMGIGIDSEDLLCEIFFRLPPISLVRFKYVSKSWYSLISNPDFLLRHWNYNNGNDTKRRRIDLLLLEPSDHDCPAVDIINSDLSIIRLNVFQPMPMITSKDEQHLHFVLNDSCNGLLLYHSYVSYNDNSTTVFYVCNPITKHYIKLPDIELNNFVEQKKYKTFLDTKKACIVFDPSVSLSYKVIRCCSTPIQHCLRLYTLYVYSSETSSWKVLHRFNGIFEPAGFRCTALLNGVFYWYTEFGCSHCLCFEVEKENVWILVAPLKLKNHRDFLYFGNCGGRLCLIEKYGYHDNPKNAVLCFPCSFSIMEMEQQEKHCIWTLKYRVNIDGGFDHLIRKLQCQRQPFEVRIMHLYKMMTEKKKDDDEEALLLMMNIVDTNMVVSFNVTTNTFGEELIVIPNINHVSVLRDVVPYTPTLFPV